jgi:hypothetical protein
LSEQKSKSRRGRRLRRGDQPSAANHPAGDETLASLEAELVLLREENAELKAAKHSEAGVGRLLERARAVSEQPFDAENAGDETAHMLTEILVTREALRGICVEIERSMAAISARLDAMVPEPALRSSNGHVRGNGHVQA